MTIRANIKQLTLNVGLFTFIMSAPLSFAADDNSLNDVKPTFEKDIQQIGHYEEFDPVGLEKETPTIIDSDQDGVALHLDQCRSTPFNVPVDENGCGICPEGSLKDEKGCYTLNREIKTYPLHVKFTTDSYIISDQYKAEIFQIADFFIETDAPKVIIEGHTDSVGSESSNITLSHNRAKAVAAALKEFGMEESRIEYQGFGEGMPIADNETRDGRKQNRRVNAVVELVKESKVYIYYH